VLVVAVFITKVPVPLTFIAAFILILFAAVNVRLFKLQLTTSLTLIFPDADVPLTVPADDSIIGLVVWRAVVKAVPVISPPLAAIVKSAGSISQLPVFPLTASVVIFALSAILTCEALVSILPPLPPLGALALSVPPTLVVPDTIPANNVIFPPIFCSVCASITPVFFTTLASKLSLAPALMMTMPPSAFISCLFSARLLSVLWSI